MVPIMHLLIPILVAAVLVFVLSAIIHMALPIHRGEFKQLPAESDIMDAIRKAGVQPGEYMFPHHGGNMAAMKDPAWIEKFTRGPVATMIVRTPGPPSMTKNLVQWFLYSILVGIFAAYVAGRALGPGAPYLSVFRFAGVTAFSCYGMAMTQGSIWGGRPWGTTLKHMFDSLLYGLVTAGTFGWLWPK